MRRIKLLIFLSLAGVSFSAILAAQDPKHPNLKRGRTITSPDRPGRWKRERKEDSLKRAPERESAEKKSTNREELSGTRSRTRDRAGAWDRRQQWTEKRSVGRRSGDKARSWEPSLPEKGAELKPSQQAKLIEHVFSGVKRKGEVQGFHYEGAQKQIRADFRRATAGTRVIENTRTEPDSRGVYRAKVEVRGIEKKHYSSFFPRSWSKAGVLKTIDEAYANRRQINTKRPNYLEGVAANGMTVGMLFNKSGEIVSAFPIYGK